MKTRHSSKPAGLALALALWAGSSGAVDLTASYQRALQADPSLRAAQAALLAGREKAVQGDALLKPQVGLTASVGHLNDRSSSSLRPPLSELIRSSSSGSVQQAAVQLKQPVYDVKSAAERQQLHW